MTRGSGDRYWLPTGALTGSMLNLWDAFSFVIHGLVNQHNITGVPGFRLGFYVVKWEAPNKP